MPEQSSPPAHAADSALAALVSRHLPTGYALYAVSDPDGILADAVVLAALREHGLRIVAAADPFHLRRDLLAEGNGTAAQPLAVVTRGPVKSLPYDIWQQARHVDLALHRLFPNLDYVTLQQLTPPERARLAAAVAADPPLAPLGARSTQRYLLDHIFADTTTLPEWLQGPDRAHTAAAVRALRDTPAWALAALAEDEQARRAQHALELLDAVEQMLGTGDPTAPTPQPPRRWTDWQGIARQWAQFTLYRYDAAHPLPPTLAERITAVETRLDAAFAAWVQGNYAALAGQRLPDPHQLFHVHTYLNKRRSSQGRIALLVLDGMSLAAWQRIRRQWQARHQSWRLDERLLLSQVPSVTAIARQALVAGEPPQRFAGSLTSNDHEESQWRASWVREGLGERAAAYALVPPSYPRTLPAAIDSSYTQLLCVVLPDIDKLVHGAQQGMKEVLAALDVWLQETDPLRGSAWVETLIQSLLDHGYWVALTSDHGHVEASGMGQPREGVTVESRALRARLYDRGHFALNVQAEYPDTILWHGDGLLPDDRWVLMPRGRLAFAPLGAQVVSHGGLTIEELVVPLATITQ